MTVLQFVRDIDRSSGGPSFSVPSLCTALSQLPDTRVELIAQQSDQPLIPPDSPVLHSHFLKGNVRREIHGIFDRFAGEGSVVHVNGLWDPFLHFAITEARTRKIPLVVSVRGMLERSAFAHKRWKKTAGWWLYQKRDLRSAAVIHATSPSEVDSIRRFGLCNPIVQLPNGLPDPDSTGLAPRKDPVILFLGRLHPIKGLDILLEAWARAPRQGWTLQISGPDEDGHAGELHKLIRDLCIEESVRFTGPLEGEAKWDALAGASCLVLPSHSENFGMVVAEALSAGTAVAASTGTPWQKLPEQNAGWWVPSEPGAFAEVIDTITSTPEPELRQMGENGREWIRRDYSWPALIARYEKVYRWLVGDGSKPDDVVGVSGMKFSRQAFPTE